MAWIIPSRRWSGNSTHPLTKQSSRKRMVRRRESGSFAIGGSSLKALPALDDSFVDGGRQGRSLTVEHRTS